MLSHRRIPVPGNRPCSSGLWSAKGSERSEAVGWCGWSWQPGCYGPSPGCRGTGGWWQGGRADGRRGRYVGCTGAGSRTGTGPWAGRCQGNPDQSWDGLDGKENETGRVQHWEIKLPVAGYCIDCHMAHLLLHYYQVSEDFKYKTGKFKWQIDYLNSH